MPNKDIAEVKALFQTGYHEKQRLQPLTKYDDKKGMVADNYMVYSFSALPALIEKMKQRDTELFGEKYTARFVIEENGTPWFALEGSPGDDVSYNAEVGVYEQAPAHSVMISKDSPIIAAGIVVFSDDYQIKKITNFSGHFRPKATTLIWPLAALLNLNADFADEVELGFFWKNNLNQLQHKAVALPKAQLHALLPKTCIVTPNSSYEIRVYSNNTWVHFGLEQTPQFQKKRERQSTTRYTEHRDRLFSGSATPYANKRNRLSFIDIDTEFNTNSVSSSSSSQAPLIPTVAASQFIYSSPPSTPPSSSQSFQAAPEIFSDHNDDEQDGMGRTSPFRT